MGVGALTAKLTLGIAAGAALAIILTLVVAAVVALDERRRKRTVPSTRDTKQPMPMAIPQYIPPKVESSTSSKPADSSDPTSRKILVRDWTVQGLEGSSCSGSFEAIEPSDLLGQVAIMSQALDNQWVSRSLLRQMLEHPPTDGLRGVEAARHPSVRMEYMRALINGETLVVNRAFMYNTSAVSQDYTRSYGATAETRNAFKALLSQGAVIPYLLTEQTPADLPQGVDQSKAGDFPFDAPALMQWQQVLQEVRPRCIRMSWDDTGNKLLTEPMFAAYHSRINNIGLPLQYGQYDRYLQDCGVPSVQRGDFANQLRLVAKWSADQPRMSRNGLYQEFIVADGTETHLGKYDPDKPYSYALKQLFDLDYSVNLTDALGLYTLTPIDSLPRTALQELTVRARQAAGQGAELSPDDLGSLVRQFKFSLSQGGAYLRSMGDLTLQDVLTIRDTDEWKGYIRALRILLDSTAAPEDALGKGLLQSQMEQVYSRYADLARVMTRHVKVHRADAAVETWTPLASLIIDVGGALLTAAIVPSAAGFGAAFVYGVAGNIFQDKVGMVARLLIRGTATLGAQADLENSLDFMRAKLKDARELIERTGDEARVPILDQAGFMYVDNLQARLTRQYDETVNFPEEQAAIA